MKDHIHHDNGWTTLQGWTSWKVYDIYGSLKAKFPYRHKAIEYVRDQIRKEEDRGW